MIPTGTETWLPVAIVVYLATLGAICATYMRKGRT